jgi:DNA repair protein RadD
MILRDYQRRAVGDLFAYFDEHTGNPCAILPTAAGKSVILATFIKEACERYPGTRIIVLTHVAKLLKQNAEKLAQVWPSAPFDFYSASIGRKNHRAQVLFAGIQSIWKQAYKVQECDLILVDEAHLISPKDTTRYRKFLADMKVINPHLKIAGLTASPWRLDSGVIYGQTDSLFTDCCHETTIPELIELGYLCPIQTKHTAKELDVSGVHVRGGEFVASELAQAVDKDEVTRACVDEIVKLDARPGLCFATGVKHAYHIRDEIRSRGYSCEVIDGETPEHERDRHLDALVAGRLDYLSNCAVLTTGVDLPPLRMIADLAPTKSPALHVQKLGRLMRLHPGKDVGIVLDFARNVDEHGPIDLIKPKPKGKGGTGEPVVKTCPECEEKCATALRQCPVCGHEFPPPEVKFQAVASKAPILSTQIEPTWIAVTEVTYAKHEKPGKPASLKVTYRCGMVFHHEWICLEHVGFARQKAEAWWMKRGQQPIPATVDIALTRANELRKPEAISVRPEGKYVRVIGYDFGEQRRVA